MEQDLVQAEELYRQAANQGLPVAWWNLSSLYLDSCHEGKDEDENVDCSQSVYCLRKAAAAGHRDSVFHLACCYRDGSYGVEYNFFRARQLFKQAPQLGNVDAEGECEKLGSDNAADDSDDDASSLWADCAGLH